MKRAKGIYLALLIMLSPMAHADPVFLDYVGNPFDFLYQFGTPPDPHSPADSVQFTLELSAELAPDLDTTIAPLSFTASDGVSLITSLLPNLETVFKFVTNSTGEITNWEVQVIQWPATAGEYQNRIYTSDFDAAEALECKEQGAFGICDYGSFAEGFNYTSGETSGSGTWSYRIPAPPPPPPTKVSEPATLALLALGLVGMAARRRKTV